MLRRLATSTTEHLTANKHVARCRKLPTVSRCVPAGSDTILNDRSFIRRGPDRRLEMFANANAKWKIANAIAARTRSVTPVLDRVLITPTLSQSLRLWWDQWLYTQRVPGVAMLLRRVGNDERAVIGQRWNVDVMLRHPSRLESNVIILVKPVQRRPRRWYSSRRPTDFFPTTRQLSLPAYPWCYEIRPPKEPIGLLIIIILELALYCGSSEWVFFYWSKTINIVSTVSYRLIFEKKKLATTNTHTWTHDRLLIQFVVSVFTLLQLLH